MKFFKREDYAINDDKEIERINQRDKLAVRNMRVLLKEVFKYFLEEELKTEVNVDSQYIKENFRRKGKRLKNEKYFSCCCSQDIMQICYLEHRKTKLVFKVGSCCVNLAIDFKDKKEKAEFWKDDCERCGNKHMNRSNNFCNDCRKIIKMEQKEMEKIEEELLKNNMRKLQMEEDKNMICECGNKKDKAVFKCCRQCLNKLYKKVYHNCVNCGKEKITEREKQFEKCFVCFQDFKNM